MLNIGDKNDKIEVVDADRLCYRVHSRNKGAEGIRTISKDIVEEFVASLKENPNQNATELREKLTGSSQIDKFEYGYNSTIYALARIELEKDDTERDFAQHDQKIFFGAPGTGKSFKVNQLVGDTKNVFRTTFHPDYDYAQFVGSYKPVVKKAKVDELSFDDLGREYENLVGDRIGHPSIRLGLLNCKNPILKSPQERARLASLVKGRDSAADEIATGVTVGNFVYAKLNENKIDYSFVPQVFANAYAAAWKNLSQPVYLVIEEINRGNCAQIFGDLFQLLDRDENGYSSYEIDADADFADWIKKQLDSSAALQNDIPEEIRSGRKLRLPPNFNVLATMNTSDQSLFPMDSAFKRRFDWEYVPISFDGKSAADFRIEIGDKKYSWQTFVENVNEKILDLTESEDKQLGEYFVQPDKPDNIISEERFKGKVMFYLWNEVCKDYHKNESFFKIDGKYFTFQDLYKDGSKLVAFMGEMMVPAED